MGNDRDFLAVTIFVPEQLATRALPVLFFFPGGGFNRHYFDLHAEGFDNYSQCRHHAANGFLCVAVDHLGVGDSSMPTSGRHPEDGLLASESRDPLALANLAMCTNQLVQAVLAELRAGECIGGLDPIESPYAIGIGQSMGGHIVALAQANHACFAAVAMLGSSFTHTRLVMKDGARRAFRTLPFDERMAVEFGDVDMQASFHTSHHPEALVAMDMDATTLAPWRSATVPAAAVDLMKPAILAREAAAIHVPVLLVYGEIDVTAEPLDDVRAFTGTADISLLLVPGMGHMHNFAPTRETVWARIEMFARTCLTLHHQPTSN